jgi:redox-sensitive bicupin YhaK (pirin superfamily)
MSPVELRRGDTRGTLHNDWLQARFSFSFGDHDDPRRRRFGPLLALNDDRVQPCGGFPMHPHRDLEIVMLPLRGAIAHRDDRGGAGVLRPGSFQWIRAGTGIRHSQYNASAEEMDHHLQIWFEPGARGLEPDVVQAAYASPPAGAWRTLVSPHGDTGALDIGVDAVLALGQAGPDGPLAVAHRPGRGLYLHAVDGTAELLADGQPLATLAPGDAAVFFDGAPDLTLRAADRARLLCIDTVAVDPATGRPLGRHSRSFIPSGAHP